MISTVTTTTITAVVTLATGASFSVIVSLLLISMLGSKEMTSKEERLPFKKYSKNINVCILPIALVFIILVATKVLEAIV